MRPDDQPLTFSATLGVAIIGLNLVVSLLAPWIAPNAPGDIIGGVWAPPDATAWFGYDNLGRDIFSRVIHGAQITVWAAIAASICSYLLGGTAAIAAVLAGPKADAVISRLMDILMAVPTLIFALALLTVFQGTLALIFIIGVFSAPRVFRVARAVVMDIVALDYIEAAKLRGEKLWWIVVQEILPNALPALAAEFGMRMCFSLLFISSLSFLGFGVQPPQADWGTMVRENAAVIGFGGLAPLYPAGALALLTIGVNLTVDWISSSGARLAEVSK